MKKILLAVLVAGTLAGCNETTEAHPKTVNPGNIEYRCVDGVMYYRYGHGLAPAFNTDGTIKLCDM